MSDGQVAAVYGAEVDADMLAEAGYVADEGLWWARSMRQVFDPSRFLMPIEVRDPFGNPPTQVSYDADVLFATSVTDAVGNVTSAEYDYRVLTPRLVTDPNGTRGGVVFDVRGMVVAMGPGMMSLFTAPFIGGSSPRMRPLCRLSPVRSRKCTR